MTHDLSFPEGPIVLDASTVINVLGTGRGQAVLEGLAVRCLIEERTLAEITRHPIEGLCHKGELAALHKACLDVRRMSSSEYATYLGLVSAPNPNSLGSGESAAIAFAIDQNFPVILDDGKARRLCANTFPTCVMSSSLKLLVAASYRAGWASGVLRDVVTQARANARMSIVKGEESLFQWVMGLTSSPNL